MKFINSINKFNNFFGNKNLSDEDQIVRIKKKLPLAKLKDTSLSVFGSNSHKYTLYEPLSAEEVEGFESMNNIVLPEEYKLFVTNIGNGGAGPYYGIYKLDVKKKNEYLKNPCKLHPNLSDEEWDSITSIQSNKDIYDNQIDMYYAEIFQGMLLIGTQGCSYRMMLIVSGEYRGKVVYIDEELQTPIFTYENHFLDWYERWLDEIIKGYIIKWFGIDMGGDDMELISKFHKCKEDDKAIAIMSMGKIPKLFPSSISFLEEQCYNQTKSIKLAAIQMLAKLSFNKSKPFLKEMLFCDDEDLQLSALKNINWYAKNEITEFWDDILTILNEVKKPDFFTTITNILEKTENNISLLVPFFYNSNKEIRKHAIYHVGISKERTKYINDFIKCLQDKEEEIISTTIQALRGETSLELLPHYAMLLIRYPKYGKSYIRNFVVQNLKIYGLTSKLVIEKYGKL